MKLSIIVPVYNMASDGKLNYCLDSLLAQTITDYEILAVDDASTDNSLEILRQYEKKYPDIFHVIHYDQNKRQGGAKNEGLKRAKGDWIGFIDSDDWITHDFYQKLIGKGEESGADVVGCDYNLVQEHTMTVGKIIQNNSLEQTGKVTPEIRKKLCLRPGSMVIKVYRRELIHENHLDFPEKIFYEDNCAGSIWMLYCKHFEKVEEPLYYYYQHEVSTVHYISEAKCRDRMISGEKLVEESRERGLLSANKEELEYRFTEIYYATTLFSYLSGIQAGFFKKLSFISELRAGMKRHFPDFQQNLYYQSMMGAEEKKLIGIQMKSNLLFLSYYLLLHKVREWKK